MKLQNTHSPFGFSRLAAAALALLLCACGQAAPAGAPSGVPDEAAGSASAGSSQSETAAGSLLRLRPYTDAGLYAAGYNGSTQLLTYLDFEACQEVPLCALPNCTHTTESCSAYLPQGKGVRSLYTDGERLLMLQIDYEGGPTELVAAEPDGSSRRQLAQLPGGLIPEDAAFTDGDCFYFLAIDAANGGGPVVCRVPLDGGAVETLFALPAGGLNLLGADGRRLLLESTDYSALEEYSRTYSGQYGSAEEQAAFAALEQPVRLYWKDIDTGEEQDVDTWVMGQEENGLASNARTLCYTEGKIYWVDAALPEGAALHWIDAGGQTGETALHWPGRPSGSLLNCTLRTPVNGLLQLQLTADDTSLRCLVDPATGETTEIPLSILSNGHEAPVPIVALTDSDLLVEYAEQMQDVTFLHEDGTPDTTGEVLCRYALISYEDFLAGNANYRDVFTSYAAALDALID